MVFDADVRKILIDGAHALDIPLSDEECTKLLGYISLLLKWNRTYSLTAIVDIEDVVRYHILDGLTVVKYLNQTNQNFDSILDVGSGMGVPGIILAICYVDKRVFLLDSNSKKSAFLKQVCIELNLSNVEIINARVEKYCSINKFDIIISRAFARLDLFVKVATHLLKSNGVFVAMKSRKSIEEINLLGQYIVECNEIKIPDLPDKRFLIKISNERHNSCN